MAKKGHYVDSQVIEEYWDGWKLTGCEYAWQELSAMIYKICEGVATQFAPRSEEEHSELTHEGYQSVMNKIRVGKLVSNKKSPVFNVLTTAIFRHLYSSKNREKRRTEIYNKYMEREIDKNPQLLEICQTSQAVGTRY